MESFVHHTPKTRPGRATIMKEPLPQRKKAPRLQHTAEAIHLELPGKHPATNEEHSCEAESNQPAADRMYRAGEHPPPHRDLYTILTAGDRGGAGLFGRRGGGGGGGRRGVGGRRGGPGGRRRGGSGAAAGMPGYNTAHALRTCCGGHGKNRRLDSH